jgi:hypothetical protein
MLRADWGADEFCKPVPLISFVEYILHVGIGGIELRVASGSQPKLFNSSGRAWYSSRMR